MTENDDPFGKMLDEAGVSFTRRPPQPGVTMNAGDTIQIVQDIASNPSLLTAIATVLVVWIKSRTSRKAMFTTKENEVVHAFEGMSPDEIERLVKLSRSIAVIDTAPKTKIKDNKKGPGKWVPQGNGGTQKPTCFVCGDTVMMDASRQNNTEPQSCFDAQCRVIAEQRKRLPPGSFQPDFSLQSRLIRTRRAAAKQHRLLSQQVAESRAAENQQHWGDLSEITAVPPTARVLRLVIPNGRAPLQPQDAARRETHRKHLQTILAETQGLPALLPITADQPTADAAEESMSGQLCTMCGGGCCVRGGDAAYLTAETMQRVMATQINPEGVELLERYMSLLPQESTDGSCIYHGAAGCALPRELRSDTCNRYCCASLIELISAFGQSDGSETVALVLQRHQNLWEQGSPSLENPIIAAAVMTNVDTVPIAR